MSSYIGMCAYYRTRHAVQLCLHFVKHFSA